MSDPKPTEQKDPMTMNAKELEAYIEAKKKADRAVINELNAVLRYRKAAEAK